MDCNLRVFVADDHTVVREGLKALINSQSDMAVVGEAESGVGLVENAVACGPDVALLDITMPGLSGIEATRQLMQAAPKTRVLTLTVHEDPAYLQRAIDAGAHGYLLKRAAASELIGAIRSVAAGEFYTDSSLSGRLVRDSNGHSQSQGKPHADLSEREEQVLRFIAQGYTTKEIAAELGISAKTVETYKSRSLEKLGLFGRVDIVRYALRRGWLQDGEPGA